VIAPYRPIMNSAPDQHLTTGLDLLAQVDAEASADPATRAQLHLLAAIAEGLHRTQDATAGRRRPARPPERAAPTAASRSIWDVLWLVSTALLALVAVGLGVVTAVMVYRVAERSDGPDWPTLTAGSHHISVGGAMGAFTVVGTLAVLIALRAVDRLLPTTPPPRRMTLFLLGFGALATATCAAGGRTPAEVVLRGLAPAGAVLIAMALTQHPGRPAQDDQPADGPDA
jgi:hypothetical protein